MSKRGRSGARSAGRSDAAQSKAGGAPARGQPGKVRIIGGRWRGTRLDVADAPGLRPTSDRVRETLFNWLQPMLSGARVLDLFAGSGALGLEALSRGAAGAVLVERDPALAAQLRALAARLPGGEAAQVVQADALAWLAQQPVAAGAAGEGGAGFDLAFVDPPFAAGLWDAVWPALSPRLAPAAWLYVEAPLAASLALPAPWLPHREGATREVRYALYRRAG
ncbi:16S rRNA (guanine(966)-N(2))-methyltransferase RsmD [Lysobacter yananisis]|uniref:Ribosomal RNA small subunit methyltransferase D n=1 Tax=Lysobacter yananisis TaxID=1003114 RepID=A0ABY9P633_9GAMM|nr:16S rRNA (guanine(966)-N(2))-methyltransferase RsmD [Lysobacter yananisis]WMT01317.1 16S rRNA (guanine(966)-N(2))-methyltransferase RsmD [Lysobacter yananisis]